MKIHIRRIVLTLATAVILNLVAGCKHTAHGAGQDIERAGEKIQEKTQ